MPLYFLHVFNRTGWSRDDEGQDLPDLAAARGAAVDGIRSILSDEVVHGAIDFEGRVDIVDEAGNLLESVSFADAVELRREGESE
ncbi:MAG TPA: hypothetical protein VKI45_04150 [Allosphingosinicella sp.]|nr:hypothetical protein [Allosphingosinicella sp.]